jgi:hypothetical protein
MFPFLAQPVAISIRFVSNAVLSIVRGSKSVSVQEGRHTNLGAWAGVICAVAASIYNHQRELKGTAIEEMGTVAHLI